MGAVEDLGISEGKEKKEKSASEMAEHFMNSFVAGAKDYYEDMVHTAQGKQNPDQMKHRKEYFKKYYGE